MKLLLLVLIFCNISIYAAEKQHVIKFGHIIGELLPENKHFIHLTYDFLIRNYAKKYNLNIEMNYELSANKNVELFQKGEIAYLAMTPLTCAKLFNKLQNYVEDGYIVTQNNTPLSRYVVLTSMNPLVDKNKLLNKKAIIVADDTNAMVYLDMFCINSFDKTGNEALHVENAKTPNQAILKIYFGDAELAFVPMNSWKLATTMNPAIQSKVNVLEVSPEVFAFGIELFSNTSSKQDIELIKQANSNFYDSVEGKQLFKLLKITKREKITQDQLKSYLAYYFMYIKKMRNIQK